MFKHVGKDSGLLFASHDLRDLTERRMAAMRAEVDSLEPNRLLNTSPADLARYLVEKYGLEAPRLLRDDWSAEETETRVDVRHDQMRHVTDRSRPCLVPGQRIEVEVPIEGETELVYARASTFNFSPPRAGISGGLLRIVIEIPHDASDRNLRGEIDKTLADVDEHLSWIRNDLAGFNASLPGAADQAVNGRRQRVLANQGRASSLGIPLKKRDGTPTTYAVPDVRRKVMPKLPAAASVPYEP